MRGLSLAALLGASLACAPRPTEAKEEPPVKEAPESTPAAEAAPSDDGAAFAAARERFTAAAREVAGKGAELEIMPTAPGDHYAKDYDPLRTGDYYPWRASRGGQGTALVGFASADAAVYISPDDEAALREGKALDHDAPAIAGLLGAARLGTADAIAFADVLKRVIHLFHFGNVQRLCPMKVTESPVRVRFKLRTTGASPNTPRGPGGRGKTVPTRGTWVTLDYDAAAGIARLSTGDEGC